MRVHSKAKRSKSPAMSDANNPVSNAVFNALDVGILVVDGEGFFVDMNDCYCRMIGYERRELIGKHFLSVVPEVQRDFALYTFNDVITSPVPTHAFPEFPVQRKDGHIFSANCSATVIEKPDGARNVVVCIKDITSQKQAEEKLRQQEARHLEEKINHQRQIARATINVQEKERSEIGKELHDNVNQILASAKLFLSSPFIESEEREMFAKKAAGHINTAIDEIRKLSKSLVSPSTADLGIIETIDDMIGDIRWAQKIEVCFNHTGFDESKLDYGLKLTIYRIVQEQMNNILKYAGATTIAIILKARPKKLILTIADNGKGFDPGSKRKGIGINNIINRADVFNGRVNIQTAPGEGCILKVIFDK